MPFARKLLHWQTLLWGLMVLVVAVLLKQHYSIATAADLEWMFRPVSLLLEWSTGHSFHKDANAEWVSEGADVRLVKACAGINFMLMSFMAYAWVIRPDCRVDSSAWSWIAGRVLLLCAAILAAWITGLLANSLRIIVAMAVQTDTAEFHRLIGMLVYVPLLSLQMTIGNRSNKKEALAGPVLLYLLLMVIVPLLTGNAFQYPALFMEHLLQVSIMIAVMCGIYYLWTYRRRLVSALAVLKTYAVF